MSGLYQMRLIVMGMFGTNMEVVEDLENYNLMEPSDQLLLIQKIAATVKELRECETDDHLPPDPMDVDDEGEELDRETIEWIDSL